MNINDHRDEIAGALHRQNGCKAPDFCHGPDVRCTTLTRAERDADALLASPALARLLAAARDEARAEGWDAAADYAERGLVLNVAEAAALRQLNPYRGGAR